MAPLALRRAPRWILGGWQDLLLFIGTPALILPLAGLARERFSVADISFFVASFGATGHHLPGMLRAYGDRELFERFKLRFVAAPIFLVSVCLLFAHMDLEGVQVVLVLWGLWHGLAQIYGFGRIYDTKVGSQTSATVRLDMALGVAWFGLAVLHAPERVANLAGTFYRAGGPLIPPEGLQAFTALWGAGTAVVTLAFAANVLWRWLEGHPPSFAKLLLMGSSFGFWWFAMVGLRNVLLGIALFEIFHDVQYLAIVWVFNRKRVEQAPGVGAFTRFVFRPRAALVGLYLGLVFAYGYLAFLQGAVQDALVYKSLAGLLTASALLHFYYDGFIWKVRERSTRRGLGLSGGRDDGSSAGALPGWLVHGARWGLFAIPLALLGTAQLRGPAPRFEQFANLARLAPGAASAQYNLGIAWEERGQPAKAAAAYERALALDPGDAAARTNLGAVLQPLGDHARARRELERALELDPELVKAQNNLAWLLATTGRPGSDEARAALVWAERAARGTRRANPGVLDTLAVAYASAERFDEAVATAEAALALARQAGDRQLADAIAGRLAGFRRGEAHREAWSAESGVAPAAREGG